MGREGQEAVGKLVTEETSLAIKAAEQGHAAVGGHDTRQVRKVQQVGRLTAVGKEDKALGARSTQGK